MKKVLAVLAIAAFVALAIGSSPAFAAGESSCKALIERAQVKLSEVESRAARAEAEGWLLKAKGSHNLANYWDCEQEAVKAIDLVTK
ncbi:MAG: hypothetical protein ACE5LX_01545 [Nitrospinota bacterium]